MARFFFGNADEADLADYRGSKGIGKKHSKNQ